MRVAVVLSVLCAWLVVLAACKDFPNPFAAEKATDGALRYTYSINFVTSRASSKKGGVGQLQLHTSLVGDGIEVRGEVSTDIDIALGTPGKVYKLNDKYAGLQNPPVYNMLTLPLRLRHLARTHRQTVADSSALLQDITHFERQLMNAGKAAYADFAALHVIDSGDYGFDRLSQHNQVSFAGKRFTTSLAAVRKEIDARTAALKQSVIYQQDALRPAPKVDFDIATLYAQAVVIYRSSLPDLKRDPQPFAPSFRAKGEGDASRGDVFKEIVTHLSTLKQAKLLLAKTLLRLYEPHYLTYEFDALGYKERLSLSATANDTHRKTKRHEAVFSYKLSASSPKQGNFQLGRYDFDRTSRPVLISTSLKPIGKGRIDLVLQ